MKCMNAMSLDRYFKGVKPIDEQIREISLEGEIWKPVRNFEGRYMVSNLGRALATQSRKVRLLALSSINSNGYTVLSLYKGDGTCNVRTLHRSIMEAFHGMSELDVNHKNGIRTDARLENLEYCTRTYNIYHSYHIIKRRKFGKPVVLLNDDMMIEKDFVSVTEAAIDIGTNIANISYACNENKLRRKKLRRVKSRIYMFKCSYEDYCVKENQL